jgi:hypothetical protein
MPVIFLGDADLRRVAAFIICVKACPGPGNQSKEDWSMKPKELDAKQLAVQLMMALVRLREHLDEIDWDIFEEGIRRIREHEVLLAEVIPELRTRLAMVEGHGHGKMTND